jgi:cytochrome b6-f complex iron-sulfur subunit
MQDAIQGSADNSEVQAPAAEIENAGVGETASKSSIACKLTRRNFVKAGVGALGVLAALEIGGASVIFLQSSSGGKGERGGVIDVGAVDVFPPGSVTEFAHGGFFLVRTHDGGFLAVHRRCPHLGCTVDWVPEEERFYCPCHGSSFDFYGNFEGPPVPRPLDIFAVTIQDGAVKVDTSRTHPRESYSPDQLAYGPDGVSFIATGAGE